MQSCEITEFTAIILQAICSKKKNIAEVTGKWHDGK